MITAAQCRAARAWLNLTQAELGKMIDRGGDAVARFENDGYGNTAVSALVYDSVGKALQHALEERGIQFLMPDQFGWAGVSGPQ